MFRQFLISTLFLSISSVALAADQTSEEGISYGPGEDAQLYADYLIGSYTDYIDDPFNRAQYFEKAYQANLEDMSFGRRAITAAIVAGDIEKAEDLARQILDDHPDEPMSRALLGAQLFSAGKYKKAGKYLDFESPDVTVNILAETLAAWNHAAADDQDKGLEILEDATGGAYFQVLARVQKTNMTGLDGDLDEALDNYALAGNANIAVTETALAKTRLLSQSGDVEGALKYLKEFDDANDNFESGPVRSHLDILEAGKPIKETLSPQEEAAWVLTESAYGFFMRNRAIDVAEVYIRMALIVDPDNDRSKIWLAALIEENRPDEALELYKSVSKKSPYAVSARLSEANIYFDRDEDPAALELLEETYALYPSLTTQESLGRARLIRENYEEALPIYEEIVESMTEAEIEQNTQPLYFRAICYERTEQWDKAVADFRRVLAIEPENADALNYLGYTWVDRNENLTEAFEMIEKAVELEPQSGAIVDSLGWAHYKLGQYHEARKNLEKAVELTPDSATIIDHLGDVYWKLGRFREAGFQWKRALDYDPTEEEKDAIEQKLKSGLSSVPSN